MTVNERRAPTLRIAALRGALAAICLAAIGPVGKAVAQAPSTEAPASQRVALPAPAAQTPEAQEVSITVPATGTFGREAEMPMKVYIPDGPGPFPVVLYSHGRAGQEADRARLTQPVPLGHVGYWQRKGFAVVAPIRPGYGEKGGHDREASGVRYDLHGGCVSMPDFSMPARSAAAATLKALEWVRQEPWADKDRLVLVGQSMGGFASVATAATNPPGVVAYVNFAGGTGGDPNRSPGRGCGADAMERVMASFGKTTTVPSLWLYAENDRYWGAEAPRLWHAAFAAGGSPTTFVQTTPLPEHDGHLLMLRGGRLWSVHVDAFVRRLGF